MWNKLDKKVKTICFSLLSMSMIASCAYADDAKISYLDSVANSYLYGQTSTESNLLNINSPEARGIETSLQIDYTPDITKNNTVVNLSLRDSDIRQVLRMLASKAKLNLILDKSVEGKITLDLENVRLNDAFMLIFNTSKLTYNLTGNTITVMTLDSMKDTPYTRKNMTALPIKYINAEAIATFLNENIFKSKVFGLSTQPVVTANPRTNQILIFGTDADVTVIKRILPTLDTKPLVNNFKVNHTTPKEMAGLICDSLFSSSNGSSSSSSTKSEENNDTEEEDIVLGGGVVMCKDEASTSQSSSGDGVATLKTQPLTISYFTDLGKIGVYGGSVEQAEVIKEFIKEHDKQQMMAYVEVSLIELNETGSKQFANTWNLWTPFISLGFDGTSFNIGGSDFPFFIWGHEYTTKITTTSTDGTSTSEDTKYSRTNNRALLYSLKYSIENDNGRVLANPKIMVTNGRKATIDMTSDYISDVKSEVMTSSTQMVSATQKTYNIGKDEGISVEIVPFISPDGYVAMNITPEFSTIKQQVTNYNPNTKENDIQATLLQRRDLELRNIRVKDGETLILAGLIQEEETQNTKKVPLLGDLPFVGGFFRSNTSGKVRSEMVMLVTPHIIRDGDSTAAYEGQLGDKLYDL